VVLRFVDFWVKPLLDMPILSFEFPDWMSARAGTSPMPGEAIFVGHIRLDTSEYPIILTEMVGTFSAERAEEYCGELRELAKQGERIGAITDLRKISIPSLKVRTVLRKFSEEQQPISDRTTICSAIVVQNAVIQMIVSAIYLMIKTAYPQKVFRSMEDARAWVDAQMAAASKSSSAS